MNDLDNFSDLVAIYTSKHGPLTRNSEPLELLNWSAARGSYDTSVARNLAHCYNYDTSTRINPNWGTPSNGRQNWALVALSKSGNIYYVTDKRNVVAQYTGATKMAFDSAENVCGVVKRDLHTAGFTSVYHGYNRDDATTGPWRAWTQGVN